MIENDKCWTITYTLSDAEQKQYELDKKYLDEWITSLNADNKMGDWNELCIKSATMDEEKFKLEYHHDWIISKRVNLIVELAHEYHQRCDAFDRNICTGKNRYGESMPVSSWQLKEVNRNVLLVLRELKERIKNNPYGVTTDELIKAIQSYKF